RIDRLDPDDKRLLQAAAVIGKHFSPPLLTDITGSTDAAVHEGLARLKASEVVDQARIFPEEENTFKQPPPPEGVSGNVLAERRRLLHERILMALEQRGSEAVEVLAQHAVKGESWEKACRYLRRAGEKALRRSANQEAATILDQAVSVVAKIPETRDTLELTFDVQIDLLNAYHALGDFGKRWETLTAAEDIARRLGDDRRWALARGWIAQHLWMTADSLSEPVEIARSVLDAAKNLGDTSLEIVANHHLAGICLSLGAFDTACAVLRRNLELLSGEMGRERHTLAGFPAVLSRAWLTLPPAERGEFPEAIGLGQEALRLARSFEHAYTVLRALWELGRAFILKGEYEKAVELAESGVALGREQGFPPFVAAFMQLLGMGHAGAGRSAEGVAMLREGLATWRIQ